MSSLIVGPVLVGLVCAALGLDAQQLLLVVPLVERLGLVETLVALQADQLGAGDLGDRLGELGLAGTGWALDEDRLLEPVGEVGDAGDAVVGEVLHVSKRIAYLLDALETGLGGRQSGVGGHRHMARTYRPVEAGRESDRPRMS